MDLQLIIQIFSLRSLILSNKILLNLLIYLLFTEVLSAQQIELHGSIGASTEFYQFNSADSTLKPRRPDFNYRLFFNPVIQIGNDFQLPFNFEITKSFTQAYLPLPENENPIRNLTNPNNNVGIHPTFRWMTFHLGSHIPQFSELSTGNLPIFGAGFDFKPGNFRFGYSYGISQWAIQPDTTIHIDGSYERRFQAAKIGYGKDGHSGFYFNVVKVRDYNTGLDMNLPKIKAKEGLLATLDFRFLLTKHLSLVGEGGGSAFTNDLKSEEITDGDLSKIPDFVFIPRKTTRTDYAGKAILKINYPDWEFDLQAKYLGPGFESLGFAYVETDILDLTIAPRFSFFKKQLNLSGSIGQREDNLAKTKITTTKRFIASGNLMWMTGKQFSLSANYSNYGTRNTLDNDTLRIEFVAQNFGVSPSFHFPIGHTTNTLSLSGAKSQFTDKNLFSGLLNSNNMLALTGNWTLAYETMNIIFAGSVSRNERNTGRLDIQIWSIQPGISLFKKKAQISCGFVYSTIKQTGSTADDRLMLRPHFRIKMNRTLQLTINASTQVYHYGTIRNNTQYKESYLQTNLVKTF